MESIFENRSGKRLYAVSHTSMPMQHLQDESEDELFHADQNEGDYPEGTASGDEDKLLTILTEDRGVIFAYARGARRFKNRLAPSTGLLCYSSMVLFWNRDRYSLDYADSIEQFFELRQSVEKLALASYFAEVLDAGAERE